jgi:DNA-binding FadR family transcriptional regulator
MERMGLVSQVEAELERRLSLGLLGEDGSLPSEHKLAGYFGVCRGTVREALRRLSARGLVVQHPGRRTRAVPLDEAVTLESLSVVLDGEGRLRPGRMQLLEAFFALKRELTVELLVACCEKASEADLEQLWQALYALGDEAHWDEGERRWVRQEFALLRLAACAADRLGHALLVQSLERAFQGMAHWVLPHLDSKAVRPWALCAMNALDERNVQALRQQLPPLLQANDERLLRSLAPTHQPTTPCEPPSTVAEPPPVESPPLEAAREGLPEEVVTNLSYSRTGLCQASPIGGSPPESVCAEACREPVPPEPGESMPPGPKGELVAPPPAPMCLAPAPCSQPAAGHLCTTPSCCSGSLTASGQSQNGGSSGSGIRDGTGPALAGAERGEA